MKNISIDQITDLIDEYVDQQVEAARAVPTQGGVMTLGGAMDTQPNGTVVRFINDVLDSHLQIQDGEAFYLYQDGECCDTQKSGMRYEDVEVVAHLAEGEVIKGEEAESDSTFKKGDKVRVTSDEPDTQAKGSSKRGYVSFDVKKGMVGTVTDGLGRIPLIDFGGGVEQFIHGDYLEKVEDDRPFKKGDKVRCLTDFPRSYANGGWVSEDVRFGCLGTIVDTQGEKDGTYGISWVRESGGEITQWVYFEDFEKVEDIFAPKVGDYIEGEQYDEVPGGTRIQEDSLIWEKHPTENTWALNLGRRGLGGFITKKPIGGTILRLGTDGGLMPGDKLDTPEKFLAVPDGHYVQATTTESNIVYAGGRTWQGGAVREGDDLVMSDGRRFSLQPPEGIDLSGEGPWAYTYVGPEAPADDESTIPCEQGPTSQDAMKAFLKALADMTSEEEDEDDFDAWCDCEYCREDEDEEDSELEVGQVITTIDEFDKVPEGHRLEARATSSNMFYDEGHVDDTRYIKRAGGVAYVSPIDGHEETMLRGSVKDLLSMYWTMHYMGEA